MSKKKKTRKPQQPKLDYDAIRARDAERRKKRREKNRDKRRKIMKWVGIPVLAAGVLTAAGFGIYAYLKSSGWFLHHRIAAKTEHYEVTDAMLACYYKQCVDTYLSYMEKDESMTKFDLGKSAKEQEYQTGYSFYDMFMDTTVNAVESHLQLCEAAYAAGYTLPEEKLAECRKQAEEEDLSRYQKGVTVDDIEKAKRLSFLSQYYQSDALSAITVTDEERDEYYHQHEEDFLNVSIYGYTFPYDLEGAEPEYGITREQALETAKKLEQCKTPDEFSETVREYLTDVKHAEEKDIQDALTALKVTNLITYFSDNVQEWAKRPEAERGDTLMIDLEESGVVQACMLLEKPAPSEEPTADIRILYLASAEFDGTENAKDFAQELMEECKSNGSQLSDFTDMVNEYSQDSQTYANGGLVKGFTPSRTSYGSELTEWAFDSSRTEGDMTVVTVDDGAILAYYEKAGDEIAWKTTVYDQLYNEKKNALNEKNHSAEVKMYKENFKYVTG
ncbi:MAG: peptidylprolyl isomerase [Oscillospiraceae bacterium]|nr:peptidylprolyl isomerase [Oscillospiraceae bacterium]